LLGIARNAAGYYPEIFEEQVLNLPEASAGPEVVLGDRDEWSKAFSAIERQLANVEPGIWHHIWDLSVEHRSGSTART
jgi:hypothetical protein